MTQLPHPPPPPPLNYMHSNIKSQHPPGPKIQACTSAILSSFTTTFIPSGGSAYKVWSSREIRLMTMGVMFSIEDYGDEACKGKKQV